MSNSAYQLGGKCPYMPYLGRGQMSGGENVLHSDPVPLNYMSRSIDFARCRCDINLRGVLVSILWESFLRPNWVFLGLVCVGVLNRMLL